jgi:hypothetical protein
MIGALSSPPELLPPQAASSNAVINGIANKGYFTVFSLAFDFYLFKPPPFHAREIILWGKFLPQIKARNFVLSPASTQRWY